MFNNQSITGNIFTKSLLVLLATISFQYTSVGQINPNDLAIEKRVEARIISSFTNHNIDPIQYPSIYNNKTLNKIEFINIDDSNNTESVTYEFNYDNKCRLSEINVFSFDTLARKVNVTYSSGEIIAEYSKDTSGVTRRSITNYNQNGEITVQSSQTLNSSGQWESSTKCCTYYSNFDACGNALMIDNPNFDDPYELTYNYLGNTCLPATKEFTVQSGVSVDFKYTYLYNNNFDLKYYKNATYILGGTSEFCDIQNFSFDVDGKISSLDQDVCNGFAQKFNYKYYWNSDTSINKLVGTNVDFFPGYMSIINFEYKECTAVSTQNKLDNSFAVSPNPATNNLYLNIESIPKNDNPKIIIYNAIGHVFITRSIYESNPQIDISGLPNGLYFISINSNNRQLIKPFVKL